jgi:hypothetical protein
MQDSAETCVGQGRSRTAAPHSKPVNARGNMLTRKTKLLLSLTAALPLLFAACTDNGIFDPNDDVAGTYQLTVFANGSVGRTFTVAAGQDPDIPNGGTARIDGGSLVLNANGTFTETNNFTKTPAGGGEPFLSDFISVGTFTVNGNQLTLEANAQNGYGPRFLDGTIEFDTISYIEGGFAYEYRR